MAKNNPDDRKNILVIGGAGFIGSHLCDRLVKESNVICLDSFVTGEQKNIDHLLREYNFEFINHDINQKIDLENLSELEKFKVKVKGIQEIYNLAVPTSPKQFEKFTEETLKTNSLGTINALNLAVKFKAKFLHFSSCVVYGPRPADNSRFSEDYWGFVDLLSPRGCYDEGKRFAESAVVTFRDKYNLDTKIVRIFRTYGPRLRLNDGQMIPDFITDALDNKDLVIYGDENFSTSLCYVSDIVDGAIKVMDSEEREPVNLGGGDEVKLIDVANKIIEMTASKSKVVFEEPLLFITHLGLPDLTKAKEKVGWFPIVRLEEGLKKSIEYAKARKVLIEFKK